MKRDRVGVSQADALSRNNISRFLGKGLLSYIPGAIKPIQRAVQLEAGISDHIWDLEELVLLLKTAKTDAAA